MYFVNKMLLLLLLLLLLLSSRVDLSVENREGLFRHLFHLISSLLILENIRLYEKVSGLGIANCRNNSGPATVVMLHVKDTLI